MTPMRSTQAQHRTALRAALPVALLGAALGPLLGACASTADEALAPVEAEESTEVAAPGDSTSVSAPPTDEPAVQGGAETAAATPASFRASQDDPAPAEAAAPAPQEGEPEATAPDARAVEVAYFNTKEFKKRFALSFLSRNDIEPPVTPDEAEDLRDIIESIDDEDPEKAMRRAERANRRLPSANFDFLIGMFHFQESRYAEAIEAFDAAIDKHENFLRAHSSKGLAHFALATQVIVEDTRTDGEIAANRKMHFALAGESFRTKLALGGIDGQTYGFLGIILADQARFLEAETAFRQALLFEPEKTEWRSGLVTALLAQRRFADGASIVDSMLMDDPNNAEIWKLQGKAMIGLEDYGRATEIFGIVRDLGGADATILSTLGDLYTNQGLVELAGESYAEAFEAGAAVDRTLKGAKQLVRRSATEPAKEVLAAVEAAGVDSLDLAQKAELRKIQAQIAVREGDGEREVEILRQTVDENPLDGDALTLLAMALGKAGETAEAYQLFETAAGMEGQAAKANLEYARLRVREREYEKAIPLIKASLQADDSEAVRRYLEDVQAASARSRN